MILKKIKIQLQSKSVCNSCSRDSCSQRYKSNSYSERAVKEMERLKSRLRTRELQSKLIIEQLDSKQRIKWLQSERWIKRMRSNKCGQSIGGISYSGKDRWRSSSRSGQFSRLSSAVETAEIVTVRIADRQLQSKQRIEQFESYRLNSCSQSCRLISISQSGRQSSCRRCIS